jgi:hypothetical protein
LEIHLLLVPSHNTWPHLEFSMQTHPNTYICFVLVCWILCWDGIIRRTGALRFSMEGCPLQGAQRDAYTRLDGASCPCPNFMRPHYVLFRFCFFFFVSRWFHSCLALVPLLLYASVLVPLFLVARMFFFCN